MSGTGGEDASGGKRRVAAARRAGLRAKRHARRSGAAPAGGRSAWRAEGAAEAEMESWAFCSCVRKESDAACFCTCRDV